jgi:hypothetical protein
MWAGCPGAKRRVRPTGHEVPVRGAAAEGERASSGGRANLELRMLGRRCRRIEAAVGRVLVVTGAVKGTVEVARIASAGRDVDDRSW